MGFLLFGGEKGQVYFRLLSYGRYLNQRNLDESNVDGFGNTHDVYPIGIKGAVFQINLERNV